MYFRMKDFEFKDKKVLVRVDMNVPMDDEGNITNDRRIKHSVPTIKKLLADQAKQIILMTHVGRPKETEEKLSTKKVAEYLSALLEEEVRFVDNWSTQGIEDKIVFLENLRFNPAEKSKDREEKNAFAKQLAGLADYYVNDAFSNSHRDHASMYSVPQLIPGCASEQLEKEVNSIMNAIDNPEKPLVSIIAGLKADKLNAVRNLIDKADKILVAGALAFTLLKAFGKEIGASKSDDEGLKEFSGLIEEIKNSDKVLLPVDAVVADRFSAEAEAKVVSVDEIPKEWMALDIGPKTIKLFNEELSKAKTIVWNGPIGVFEFEKFAEGTKKIAEHIAGLDAVKIVGGGDSAAAVEKLGLKEKMTLISTGGGASLKLIEGKELKAIKALEESYAKFKN